MQITTSPDITNLLVDVQWDISGSSPAINLQNLSTGSGLANCIWWFVAISPSGTTIHQGSQTSPDKNGNWATAILSDAWPSPFNSIEWSGAPYSFQVYVQDSAGNIFYNEPQTAAICRPAGNTQLSKNTYGLASSNVSVMCQQARVYFEDTTYTSYKGISGVEVGSVLTVVYPIDETMNIPAPFSIADYSTVLVPISYSSQNYQFYQYSIYDYDLGNNTTIRIRYQTIQTFAVWCNVDLEPLVCEFNTLINDIQNGNCTDVNSANKKLAIISPKMFMVFIGTMQPLTGIDVPSLIEEIKEIGGWDCNCCGAPTGIIPQSSSIIDGYNFAINSVCGDVKGTVSVSGTNITFNLQDKSYIFSIANESPSETTAFQIVPSLSGCQQTYALKIDGHQLSTDILNIIKNDSGLVNLFNSIVNVNTGNFSLLVDGKCLFQTSSSCDYTFDILNVPTDSSFAILTSINSNPVNFAFNQSNVAALQTYLNALGYGTFVVTNPNSGEILLTSTANTHTLTSITYSVGSINYNAAMTRNCTGYVPVTANQAVQKIIDYLCGITDAEVETSEDYTICYIDPVSQTQKTVIISAGAPLSGFITELLARGCDTINYVIGISPTTCTAIKNLFPLSPTFVMQANDIILSTKQGQCASTYPVELGTAILKYGASDNNFFTAFCNLVQQCAGGQSCAPFNYFYLTVPYSSPSDDTMDILVNYNHPAASSVTITYARIDNTNSPTYITIPNVVSSPYTISGVADGQYSVGITAIYADGRKCTQMFQTTPACAGINSFSAILGGSPTSEFIISYSAASSIPKVKVNISYPNGGSWSQIYTNDGVDIDVPFPVNVYGAFSINMQPVCNEDTGYFGQPTAPVILIINDPSNPTPPSGEFTLRIENNAAGIIAQSATLGGSPTLVGSFPINNGGSSGDVSVNPITGILTVTVTGTIISGVGCAILTVNSVTVQTVNISAGAGTYSFTSRAYLNGQVVEVMLSDAACP